MRPLAPKQRLVPALALCLLAAGCGKPSWPWGDVHAGAALTRLAPDPEAPQRAMEPYGLNLGIATPWGAEQLLANVLHNPGFESVTDASLVTVGRVEEGWVLDAAPWAGRTPGFWDGAHYEVRTGAAAGRAGRVLAHARDDAPAGQAVPGQRLRLETLPAALASGDVIALSRDDDPTPAPLWWRESGEFKSVALPRPGSPGQQALQVRAGGGTARLTHYLDGITARAGKLLPVQGRWRFSVWARAADGGAASLRVRFGRDARPPFLDQRALAGSEWNLLEWEFDAQDDGPDGPLSLVIEVTGAALLDDASLGAAQPPAPGGFRPQVVAALQAMHPGVLRDWQGQLGDPLANRLAPAFARHPARYREGGHEAHFHYGLEDFLALCAATGARPWIVGAPTWSPAEWTQLGQWLSRALDRHRLPGAIVEFGNEHWNPIFRPAGIESTAALGQASDRAFASLARGSAHDARITTTLGAQAARPGHAADLAQASPHSQSVALGPYYGYEVQAGEPAATTLDRWFAQGFAAEARQMQDLATAGRLPLVYEVNLHATEGSGGEAERNAAVADPATGTLLARQLLRATLAGAPWQAVYTLAGHDAKAGNGSLVKLWGVTQDLSGMAPRLRATGQVLAQLNGVARGSVRPARCEGPACASLTVAYFDAGRAVAVVSSSSQPQAIELRMPCVDGPMPLVRSWPHPDSPPAASCKDGLARLQVPARSLVTLGVSG